MGRLSALILQAVCLAGWHTERQADAYVIATNRQDWAAASAGPSSFHKSLQVLIGRGRSVFFKDGKLSITLPTNEPQTCYLFLLLEHDWWKEDTPSRGSVTTWNNPYSLMRWYGGVTFSIIGDTWKTPCSVALTTVMNLLAPLGARSGLSDIVSFTLCSSGWSLHTHKITAEFVCECVEEQNTCRCGIVACLGGGYKEAQMLMGVLKC